jgi:hypothetical protein
MLASGVLSLPDSFVAAIILAVLVLLALALRLPTAFRVVPLIAALICLAYASVVVVPANKIAVLTNVNGPDEILTQGLQFKPPWDSTKEYDDVIFAAPLGGGFDESFPRTPPMSRTISVGEDFVFSWAAEKSVDGSYLLGNACIRTFNELVKAGQSTLDEFTCNFDDTSILVLREYNRQE